MTSESYGPKAVAALRKWYAYTSKSAYVVGPLLPLGSHGASGEKVQSKEAEQIEAFLDDTLKTSGEKSLLYVSRSSVSVMTRWVYAAVVLDRLRIPLLAALKLREALGSPRRRDGAKHSLRESPQMCLILFSHRLTQVCLHRFSVTHHRSPKFQTPSKRRSRL